MSLSRVLRGDEAEAMSRWELPQVDGQADNARHADDAEEVEPEEATPRWPTADELETIRKQAYDEGFAEGREAGRQAGHEQGYKAGEKEAKKLEQEQKKRLQTLERLIEAQASPLEQLDDEVQEQMVRLVLTLARQVIRRELQTQPGEILPVIREAVALLPMSARDVRVHVHPDDHRFLNELLGEDDSGRAWRLVDDPSLSRGGCVVQAERSRVDATLERRLAQLASQLLGGREDDLVQEIGRSEAEGSSQETSENAASAVPSEDTGGGSQDDAAASGDTGVDAEEAMSGVTVQNGDDAATERTGAPLGDEPERHDEDVSDEDQASDDDADPQEPRDQ